jgi:hypothetical protein
VLDDVDAVGRVERVHRAGDSVSRGNVRSSQKQEQIVMDLGVKVFSATKARDRDLLGETITDWIRTHPDVEVFDKIVTQSSDAEFHCLAITVFYRTRAKRSE